MACFISIIFVFAVFGNVIALTEVEQACINTYSEPLDNDFLIGTWYDVYKFAIILNLIPSSSCVKTVITKAPPSDVQRYVDAYKLENPYSFNDNPILLDRHNGQFKSMIMGHNQAKFLVYDPETTYFLEDRYEARVYMKVNDDYMLFHQCSLRGHQKWLLSRKNSTTIEELDAVLKSIQSEVRNLETQRYCA
ncbi:uncharacterized protein LOC125067077 [Vanessa atalanta]|uniref:uncharacterized protein LOC125067077 n=1 Tax=Vanessa atalanta TaxID=42275 RepID=UPI001FCCF485|nr:uncharacterized protein LOC125067077 [Vanessa atalanta]